MTLRYAQSMLAGLALLASTTAADADALNDWLTGDYATGDWGGFRTDLKDAGVTFSGLYVTDLLALLDGGENHGNAWDYAGLMMASVDFDLDKLAGIDGMRLFVEGAWSSGDDLSDKAIGNLFTVAEAFTGRSVRLSQLYVEQSLFDDALSVKVGRLTGDNDFLSSQLFLQYVSGGINGTPFNVPDSTPGFTTAPFAQWGTVIAYAPIEDLTAKVGVYSSNRSVNRDGHNGLAFGLDTGRGVLTIGEVDYGWRLADGSVNLPGNVKVGGWYDTGPRQSLRNEEDSKSDNSGAYIYLDQRVYREGDSDRGLTPWVTLSVSPRQSINTVPLFFGAGAIYQGLIPGRDDDKAAIGLFVGTVTKLEDNTNEEKVLEVNYMVQVTPWFYVMPSFQYIWQPAGDPGISNAAVFGGEIGITF